MKLPLFKLVSITSNRAIAMTGRNNGFIALCKQDDDFPDFLSYHCIIHQQVLASKRLNTKDVMDKTFKIVNSIRGKPLQRRLFKMQNENKEVDLILHTARIFRDLLDDIVQFLEDRGDSFPQIRDVNWLCDLAFLADFTGHLSDLNLKLQGKNIIIIDLISCVPAFKANALILIRDLEKKNLQRFSNVEDHTRKYPNVVFDSKKYVIEIKAVIDDFDVRFNDFKKLEDVIPFINDCKKAAQLFQIDEESLEDEMINVRCNVYLKAKLSENNFWHLVSKEEFPNLRQCAESVYSCFGSTYLCESAFSYLLQTKSKARSRFTDMHSEDSLRLALSSYTPEFVKLSNQMSIKVGLPCLRWTKLVSVHGLLKTTFNGSDDLQLKILVCDPENFQIPSHHLAPIEEKRMDFFDVSTNSAAVLCILRARRPTNCFKNLNCILLQCIFYRLWATVRLGQVVRLSDNFIIWVIQGDDVKFFQTLETQINNTAAVGLESIIWAFPKSEMIHFAAFSSLVRSNNFWSFIKCRRPIQAMLVIGKWPRGSVNSRIRPYTNALAHLEAIQFVVMEVV
ncbi:hypothetical protein AGLY_008011 [Aphis glycines]|uniref:HAT C-terminal dimerisation domain-containing protein n=1 Tax=Aphis glycines TaxID=307491 RepID=A0A6G0TP76_APHGL|nr:hypothetical protein AGLY_008011 [Aphis glycines]